MVHAVLCITVDTTVVMLGLVCAASVLIVCVFVQHIDIPPFWNNNIMAENFAFIHSSDLFAKEFLCLYL